MKIADLQTEALTKYGELELERGDGSVIRLRNLLRLNDTARRNAQVLMAALDREDAGEKIDDTDAFDRLAHQERTVRDLFLLVADDTDAMKAEIEGWDMPLMLLVLERWMEETQAGEAESSAG